MKKLVETNAPSVFIPTKKPVMTESKIREGVQVLSVEGIFGKVNARNENNRRYPDSVWDKNLGEGSPFKLRMESRAVLGELEHPDSGNTHLERVSHIITAAWVEEIDSAKIAEMGLTEAEVTPGKYVMGRYEVLNTPKGNILRALHEAGVRVGISSRGRGDIRQVDGIDEVCDDYELDTWDTVYLPSVTEANPRPVRTEADDLGSDMPLAAKEQAADMTPTTGVPEGDWKAEAEEIIRALEKAVSGETADVVDMIEVFPRGINLIDQLAVIDDDEAIKLKAQALTLIRVLTTQIQDVEVGKMPAPGMPKEEPKEAPKEEPKDKDDKDDKGDKDKDDKEKKEEGSMKDLATTIKDNPDRENKPMMKGDVEAMLNASGHDSSDILVTELGNELRAQGLEVDTAKYETLQEASKEGMEKLVDGTIVNVSAKNLLKRFQETEECLKAHPEVAEFLEKQEGDLLVRVCSKGEKGYVVRLLEPAYGESNIFVKYGDVKPAVTESKTKEERKMNMKEMLAEAVKENDALKAKMKNMVPLKRYEAAKQVISDLQTQTETVDKDVKSVPVKRYEAAKKLIAGLVERCKTAVKSEAVQTKRVEAAKKLLHKMVTEKKADDGDDKDKDKAKAKKAKDKKDKKEGKKPGVRDGSGPVGGKEGKRKAAGEKCPNESVEGEEVAGLDEAIQVSGKANRAKKDAAFMATLPEEFNEAVEAPAKITEESQELKNRLRSSAKADAKPAVKEAVNLMDATIKKVS